MNDVDTDFFTEPIDDVGKSTKEVVFGKYRKLSIPWIVASIIWAIFVSIVYATYFPDLETDVVFFVAIAPALGFGIWWLNLKNKVHSAFMAQFAALNKFSFSKQGNLNSSRGVIFSFGHSQKAINEVSGTLDGYPVRLYNFESTTGQGKHSETHLFTLFEMTAVNEIPQLFLNSKKAPFMSDSYNPVSLSKKNVLKLEGDFNEYFDLYVPIQYEQEALQIFTPNIMAELIDTAQAYDLEIVGRQVRIITKDYVMDAKTLNAMHAHAKHLIKLFEKTLTKFNYQLIGDFSPELKPATRFGLSPMTITVIFMLFWVLGLAVFIYFYFKEPSVFIDAMLANPGIR